MDSHRSSARGRRTFGPDLRPEMPLTHEDRLTELLGERLRKDVARNRDLLSLKSASLATESRAATPDRARSTSDFASYPPCGPRAIFDASIQK